MWLISEVEKMTVDGWLSQRVAVRRRKIAASFNRQLEASFERFKIRRHLSVIMDDKKKAAKAEHFELPS